MWQEFNRSSYIKEHRIVHHPGEVRQPGKGSWTRGRIQEGDERNTVRALGAQGMASRRAFFLHVHTCPHLPQVNKIREIPQHPDLVVTHTDSPEVYLWNMEKQPSRSRDKVCG